MAPNEEELYQEHILDHYEDPYHRGKCRTCTHAHEDTIRCAATSSAWSCRSTITGR